MKESARKYVPLFLVSLIILSFSDCHKERGVEQSRKETSNLHQEINESYARELLLKQPDFTAEEVFSEFEPARRGGFSVALKFAKKGEYYRRETDIMVFFYTFGEPIIRYWRAARTFDPPSKDNAPPVWYEQAFNPEIFANNEGIVFQGAGTEVVDGHYCLKIRATKRGASPTGEETKEVVFLYTTKDLRNLVIKTEIILADRKKKCLLRNISFEVPNKLFRELARYKPKIDKAPKLKEVSKH